MAQDLDLEERSSKGSNRGGKSGGRGKNSRVGEGRKGENREVAISKALSKLLRHSAADEGLDIDSEGFARVGQVVSISIFLYADLYYFSDALFPFPLSNHSIT